jgi:phage shock protein A
MGILDRISQLTRANINDLLDRAEDPEKMLNQILRDMETNIRQAREQVASMIAQEKEIEIDLAKAQQLSSEWGDKAQRAVGAGKDDLAREALRRKRDNDETSSVYSSQLTTQEQTVTKLKQQLQALESKYQSTLSQRDVLIARQRRAHAQVKVAESLSEFSPMDPSADLDRMERKIRSGEARAAALTELGDESYEAQFRELDVDTDIEAQLAALKGEPAPAAAAIPSSTSTAAPEDPALPSSTTPSA